MQTRKASIKETGEELSPADWERFDAAVAELKAERQRGTTPENDEALARDAKRDDQAVA